MNPDLEKRVPREILAELIEEGTEAFRGILEKLFNVAMQLERSEFLGAEAYERTASRRGYRNGFKGKRIQTRVGELHLEIPQVRGLRFYPKSLERGCRSEKALKLAIAEMYVMGVSTRKVTEITEQLCGLEISATQVSRVAGMLDEELEEFRSRELGEYPIVYLDGIVTLIVLGRKGPYWIPFQAAALALSHTLNASFRNRLNVSLLHK